MYDDLSHPDLEALATRLDRRLAEVLRREQEAATIEARRMTTLRDRLLEMEDREQTATVVVRGGGSYTGVLQVAVDHVEVWGARRVVVHLDDVVAVEVG